MVISTWDVIYSPKWRKRPLIFSKLKRTQLLHDCLTVNLSRITRYSIASTAEAAFLIGGRVDHPNDGSSTVSDAITKFENDKWSPFGNLQKRRFHHRSITYGSETIVIGGWTSDDS